MAPTLGQPKQMVRLPAHWVETYVQLAQTGRKEREHLLTQLNDLDYQLEQLEADGTALQAELNSHIGYGTVAKTLMASLRSVLSLSQTLQLSSQQTQQGLQQQHQWQQRLHDHLEDWQAVPLGRLEYPLQLHLQHLQQHTGRAIALRIEGAHQTVDPQQVKAWQKPLELLISQAVHHSLEGPTERAKSGKPAALQLILNIQPDHTLTLSDDGQGIPLAPLMHRARSLGLPAQALQSTPTKLLALLFEPQIAATLATQPLPGAGTELITAASELQQLGGTLRIHSQVGVGTTYILTLPPQASLSNS